MAVDVSIRVSVLCFVLLSMYIHLFSFSDVRVLDKVNGILLSEFETSLLEFISGHLRKGEGFQDYLAGQLFRLRV